MVSKERERYKPTKSDIEYWFKIINDAVFKNKLPDFHKIRVRSLKDAWAWFEYFHDTGGFELQMHHTYASKQLFINILAHEMVHLYQQINNEPVGHGKTFTVWAPAFKENYLILQRTW